MSRGEFIIDSLSVTLLFVIDCRRLPDQISTRVARSLSHRVINYSEPIYRASLSSISPPSFQGDQTGPSSAPLSRTTLHSIAAGVTPTGESPAPPRRAGRTPGPHTQAPAAANRLETV